MDLSDVLNLLPASQSAYYQQRGAQVIDFTAAHDNRRRAAAYAAAVDRARTLGYGEVAAKAFGRAARMALGEYESPEHCARRVVLPMRASATTGDVA